MVAANVLFCGVILAGRPLPRFGEDEFARAEKVRYPPIVLKNYLLQLQTSKKRVAVLRQATWAPRCRRNSHSLEFFLQNLAPARCRRVFQHYPPFIQDVFTTATNTLRLHLTLASSTKQPSVRNRAIDRKHPLRPVTGAAGRMLSSHML